VTEPAASAAARIRSHRASSRAAGDAPRPVSPDAAAIAASRERSSRHAAVTSGSPERTRHEQVLAGEAAVAVQVRVAPPLGGEGDVAAAALARQRLPDEPEAAA